jgi:acyl dehydratase
MMAGRWFDEWQVGDTVRHPIRRTVTETDNLLFSTMTHNPQPLHLDIEAARASGFGQILVNSTFTFGLMIGLSVAETTLGTLIANLGFDKVVTPNPVFIGDTLHATTGIVELRESRSRPDAGIVTFEHRLYNQRGEIVCQCLRNGLLQKRPTGKIRKDDPPDGTGCMKMEDVAAIVTGGAAPSQA